jgi:hypothetical protein
MAGEASKNHRGKKKVGVVHEKDATRARARQAELTHEDTHLLLSEEPGGAGGQGPQKSLEHENGHLFPWRTKPPLSPHTPRLPSEELAEHGTHGCGCVCG